MLVILCAIPIKDQRIIIYQPYNELFLNKYTILRAFLGVNLCNFVS